MRNRLPFVVLLLLWFLALVPSSTVTAAERPATYQQRVHRRLVQRRVRRRVYHRRVHSGYYIRHRTKWQHAKIIGGGAKTGASVGGLIGGPPGMAAGAAVGAGAGTAYDLKTRKVKVRRKTNS